VSGNREASPSFKLAMDENMLSVYRDKLLQQQSSLTVLIVGEEPSLQLLTGI
jgi:hypothetical protein